VSIAFDTSAAPTNPFGKYRIRAHWIVDETVKQSGAKLAIVGHYLPSKS
jgi:hypothetical protein